MKPHIREPRSHNLRFRFPVFLSVVSVELCCGVQCRHGGPFDPGTIISLPGFVQLDQRVNLRLGSGGNVLVGFVPHIESDLGKLPHSRETETLIRKRTLKRSCFFQVFRRALQNLLGLSHLGTDR